MSEEQTKILMTYAVVAVVWYVVQTVGCMFLFKKTGTSKIGRASCRERV